MEKYWILFIFFYCALTIEKAINTPQPYLSSMAWIHFSDKAIGIDWDNINPISKCLSDKWIQWLNKWQHLHFLFMTRCEPNGKVEREIQQLDIIWLWSTETIFWLLQIQTHLSLRWIHAFSQLLLGTLRTGWFWFITHRVTWRYLVGNVSFVLKKLSCFC